LCFSYLEADCLPNLHYALSEQPLNVFVKNILQLVTVASGGKRSRVGGEMRELGILNNAGVLCEDGMITWVGVMNDWNRTLSEHITVIDASGKVVLPGFVDSHTHMMFAGNRVEEFALRSQGATYQQIAEAGGGILNTIKRPLGN
jgi:imidazolonepropionase